MRLSLRRKTSLLATSLSLTACLAAGCGESTKETPADGGAACPAPTRGPTAHSGSVDKNETWTADTGPHIVSGEFRIRNGSTLTVEPCATVLLKAGASIELGMGGEKLIARGSADRPITIGQQDNAPWATIEVAHPGRMELTHVTVAGGGDDKFRPGALSMRGDQKTPFKPVLLVQHVRIGARGHGVYSRSNAGFDPASSDLVITASGAPGALQPLRLGDGTMATVPPGTYTGNMADEILVEAETTNAASGIQESFTLRDRGVPYRVATNLRVTSPPGGTPATLTIEPGVRVRFDKGRVFDIGHATATPAGSGILVAQGTADKPIVFTSAAATPAAGDWAGLFYKSMPRPENRLSHVRVEYAGGSCQCGLIQCGNSNNDAAIIVNADTPAGAVPPAFITNVTIAHSAGHGIFRNWLSTGGPDFTAGNTFDDVAGCRQTNPPNESKSCTGIPGCM
jgi:hypothetical protein